MSKKLLVHSFVHAALVVLYILGVVSIMLNAQKLFGDQQSILISLSILMLFVLSATIVGTLVLGRPILLYLDGKKSESLKMFGYTVGWLALGTVIFFLLNLK